MAKSAILIAGILLVFIPGCKKDAPFYSISDVKLKEAVTYLAGSYFIYTDSATLVTDSFFAIGYSTKPEEMFAYNDKVLGRWERITSAFSNRRVDNLDSSIELIFGCGGKNSLNTAYLIHRTYQNREEHTGDFLTHPFVAGDSTFNAVFFSKNIAHHPEYDVAGISYRDVFETYNFRKGHSGLHIFYSPESGPVKLRLLNATGLAKTLYLTRSKIVR